MTLKEARTKLGWTIPQAAIFIGCSIGVVSVWEQILPKKMKPEYAVKVAELISMAAKKEI